MVYKLSGSFKQALVFGLGLVLAPGGGAHQAQSGRVKEVSSDTNIHEGVYAINTTGEVFQGILHS